MAYEYLVDERIFMLDMARKYFTPEWIKRLIDALADAGFNAIMLHFSEDTGLRLESKQYPWLAGGDHTLCVYGSATGIPEDDGKYITQDEMADIVRYATSCGLAVIPSFDSPGHMNYAVKRYNAHYGTDIGNYFHKDGKVSIVHGSSANKEPEQLNYSRGIDITNPEAVAFARTLYTEYGRFFADLGCDTFDIGGDELLGFGETVDDSVSKWNNLDHWRDHARRITGDESATAYDSFLLYMNEIAALMRSLGYKKVRMWNDDVYRSFDTGWHGSAKIDKNIEIQYWTSSANNGKNTPRFYIEQGHKVYNFVGYYSYYVPGLFHRYNPTPDLIRTEWTPFVFDRERPENNLSRGESGLGGFGVCLWCDIPTAESEDEILSSLTQLFKAYGEKSRK